MPTLKKDYIYDRLDFIVEIEQFRVIFFDLGSTINSSLSLHGVEFSFHRSIEKQIGLAFFLVLDGSISKCFDEGLSLNGKMLSSRNGARGRDLEASIEIDSLYRIRMYSISAVGLLFRLLFGWRLNIVFIFDDCCVCVSSDYSGIIHETGAFEPGFFSVFGSDCCDLGLG